MLKDDKRRFRDVKRCLKMCKSYSKGLVSLTFSCYTSTMKTAIILGMITKMNTVPRRWKPTKG